MTREGSRFPWIRVAAERRLGMLFADEAARGERVSGSCHPQTRPWDGRGGRRLRGRDCAAGSGGRRARKNLLTFGFSIEGTALCHSICCVFSVLLSILSIVFLGHHRMDARY